MCRDFSTPLDDVSEWCAKAGRSDLVNLAKMRDANSQKYAEQKAHARQEALDVGHRDASQSCSTITDKNTPSSGPCEKSGSPVNGAQNQQKASSPTSSRADQTYRIGTIGKLPSQPLPFTIGLPPLLPLKKYAVPGQGKESPPITGTGTYSACYENIKPKLKALDERIDAIRRAEPKIGEGPQVLAGSCTSRLIKLYGSFEGPRTFANGARFLEERSCLELKKKYLTKACECRMRGLDFSEDEAVQDHTLDVYSAMRKLDKKLRDKGITNPVINKIVTEAADRRDCYNLQTIEILRNTEKTLQRELGP
jgi:hypothetical protein